MSWIHRVYCTIKLLLQILAALYTILVVGNLANAMKSNQNKALSFDKILHKSIS